MSVQKFSEEFAEYLRDESRRCGSADSISFAKSESDVRLALEGGAAVTIQGARTGLGAGAVPDGGQILNLSRMNRINEIQGDRLTVQPGALLQEIRRAVAEKNLFFPPDPTEASASIGGMLACNASGAMSYHYGPTRNWVHRLRVMLPGGDVLDIRRGVRASGRSFELVTERGRKISGELPELNMPAVKNAAGYFIRPDMDLLDLFIGMEGTIGVITEAELNLLPVPPVQQALCAFFADEQSALKFVRFLRSDVLPVAPVAVELFDHCALQLLRRVKAENPVFSHLPGLPAQSHTAIYFEFHGSASESVEESVAAAAERMAELGASEDDCWFADGARAIERHKAFRHATPEAVNLLIDQRRLVHPGITKLGTDMSVPDMHLELIMRMYRDDLEAAGLEHVIFGHIGSNHVHVNIIPRDLSELAQGKALYLKWAGQVVALGGSVSAEHGIGKIKVPLLNVMYGPEGIAAMRSVKKIFDPDGILNPGNMFI